MRIHPSVKQWALSFLAVDVVFWILTLWQCLTSPLDCLDAVTFGSFFFYMPFGYLADLLPSWDVGGYSAWIVLGPIFGIVGHALVGAAIGWLLRARAVKPLLSLAAAAVLTLALAGGFTYRLQQDEIARETRTELWVVEDVSSSEISYRSASISNEESPGGLTLLIDDGFGTWTLENPGMTDVWLICLSGTCEERAVDGRVRLSFEEYVAARGGCIADPEGCAYYGIGNLDLFDVTYNPLGIVSMVQRYSP